MMKNKYLVTLLCLIFLFAPILIFGQSASTDNANKLLQFLKGDGAFENWFMKGFKDIDTKIGTEAIAASIFGRAIGAFGAVIYLGYMGWQMQAGDREWEITPMLKPFFIALILSNWTDFYGLIQKPFEVLAMPSQTIFENIEREVNVVRIARFKKQNQLVDALVTLEAEKRVKKYDLEKQDKSWITELGNKFKEKLDEMNASVEEWFIRMNFKFQRLFGEIIEGIGLTMLRVSTYFIFFLQKVWSYILIVLGPIAIGMAMIPGFESSLTSWISKFININLYTFISYTVINIGQQLIVSAYEMEINRYSLMIDDAGAVKDEALLMAFVNNTGLIHIVLFTVVAYFITGIGVLMTPTIADSIVSAGGATIMSKMKQSAGKVASGGKMAGTGASVAGGKVIQAGKDVANKLKNLGKGGATPKF